MKKHNIVYMITDMVTEKIYIGCHITDDIDDGYMGSGSYLRKAYKKYGMDYFRKDILFDFDNPEDMLQKERELVNRDFIKRKDTYNIIEGGNPNTSGMILVTNNNGHNTLMFPDDEKYTSGEYFPITTGYTNVKDKDGNILKVSVKDPRYLSGELVSCFKGMVVVKDTHGKVSMVSVKDTRYLSGELISVNKGKFMVKDKHGNNYHVSETDPRYLSGELVATWTGRKHKVETKRKIGKKNSIHQKGSGNSQYGKVWVYSFELKECKKIVKNDLENFLKENPLWVKGRKMKF